MELKDTGQLRNEILQTWLKSAWVYPVQGPEERTYLRLTPGGRLKMRRRIGELEEALGVEGEELVFVVGGAADVDAGQAWSGRHRRVGGGVGASS